VVSPADRALFGQYAIIPSVQPVHATSDAPWSPDRLGEGRINHGYAYASLERTLGVLPLGTDFPVEPIDPLDTYFAAVTRKKPRNTEAAAFLPNEALSRESALKGMTLWAAMAAFEENQKGTLAPGMWADFVVVNRDLLTASEVELAKARVVETWLAGERVSR
jgi:predicted amidohydrolase YtcJ